MALALLRSFEKLDGKSIGNVKFKYKDKGAEKISKQLNLLGNMALTIGFQGQSGLAKYSTGINVATVALMQEFGTDENPARPFMKSAIEIGRNEIKEAFVEQFGKVAEGKETAIDAMSDIGKLVARLIVDRIDAANSWAKPLDSETGEEKGSTTPLKDTGLMRDSVTWAVRKGSSRGAVIRQGKP